MTEQAICARLVQHGEALLAEPWKLHAAAGRAAGPDKPLPFTGHPDADRLLNDLEGYPHAFVLACVMDRQIKAERAWLIPHTICERLGEFSFGALKRLTQGDVKTLMSEPAPLHRFNDTMSQLFWAAIQRIADQYEGDAARIWAGRPPSAEVVYRFLEFDGIGPKIASMAANILARDFHVPFADYYSIDLSADVHVRRVFGRLGLCAPNATIEQLIYKARALHPEFPGILDLPCWEIGRTWCKPRGPICSDCYMKDLCPTAEGAG